MADVLLDAASTIALVASVNCRILWSCRGESANEYAEL